ncbi:LysE family translocator [Halobacillus halophilus]|uniref:LysE family translocator n=1 Tax=Halobacillus halophilus TaxID=1570 RepID=UPI001CD7D8FB|nr:LysE family translocator [Halobacillus halophilus]MCA1009168.1 LysE family translocator [Halobacillus halophilus]
MFLLLIRQIFLGLSIAAPIGPINLEIIRRGIYQGFWPSLFVGAGGMTADLTLMFLMYKGLSEYLTLSSVQVFLLILGALVLTYTGFQSLFTKNDDITVSSNREEDLRIGLLRPYLTGLSIAAFNPLNILFWLGIYGSALSDTFKEDNLLKAFYISSAIFIGVGLWNLNLALTVHFSKGILKPRVLRTISVCSSLFLLGLGIYFAYKAVLSIFSFII